MKNIIALSLLMMLASRAEETFVFIESYRTFKPSESFQTNVVWAQKDMTKKVGYFAWGQTGKSYSQAYGGLYVRPTNWLQVGVGAGSEQARSRARLGSYAYAAKNRYSSFAIYENGGSGYWYLLLTDARVSKKWSVGTHSQAFFGHGPRAEYRFKSVGNWTASIRPAVGWDNKGGKPNVILGLRLTYFKGE